MITHWIPLLGGLFFGLLPPRCLINSECRYLRFEAMWSRVTNTQKSGQRKRRWWKLPLVWIDPFRGYIVGTLLTQAFDPVEKATAVQALLPTITTFLILFIVLAVQTSGRGDEGESLSPAAFLGGLMLGILPPMVAIAAIVLGTVTTLALTNFAAGYVVAAIATAGIGYLFLGKSPWLGVCTVLVAGPQLISWIRRTSLVMPVRC